MSFESIEKLGTDGLINLVTACTNVKERAKGKGTEVYERYTLVKSREKIRTN